MTRISIPHPDDYYDTAMCRQAFCEWLSPDSGTDPVVLTAAQALAAGHVPNSMLTADLWLFCEYVHNDLVNLNDGSYEALIDHLMECLIDEYQSRPEYSEEAGVWAYEAYCDMADDWCRS